MPAGTGGELGKCCGGRTGVLTCPLGTSWDGGCGVIILIWGLAQLGDTALTLDKGAGKFTTLNAKTKIFLIQDAPSL